MSKESGCAVPIIIGIVFLIIISSGDRPTVDVDERVIECVDVSPDTIITPAWKEYIGTDSFTKSPETLASNTNEINSLINAFYSDIHGEVNKNRGLIYDGNIKVLSFLELISKKLNNNEKLLNNEYTAAKIERQENAKEREILRVERKNKNFETGKFLFLGVLAGWVLSFILSSEEKNKNFIKKLYSVIGVKKDNDDLSTVDRIYIISIVAILIVGPLLAFEYFYM